jgi:hypothetical protein
MSLELFGTFFLAFEKCTAFWGNVYDMKLTHTQKRGVRTVK